MKKTEIIQKMIAFYRGNISDIEHFLKVYAYAALIGQAEGLDEVTQNTLELAAIVHDISCPLCREKYGNTQGQWQEAGQPLFSFVVSATLSALLWGQVCVHTLKSRSQAFLSPPVNPTSSPTSKGDLCFLC